MHIPERLIGKFVAMQLSRPVYVTGFGAVVAYRGAEHLVPQPIRELAVPRDEAAALESRGLPVPTRNAMTDFLPIVFLKEASAAGVVVELLDGGTAIEKHIDPQLVVACDLITGQNQPMPQVVDKTSRIVKP